MILPGSRIGVAVSGGADSVALLHLLNALSSELKAQLVVLHLNHCLRGDASDEDAAFVSDLAERLGWPAVIETCRVADRGGNLEQAGRRARYAFFTRQMSEHDLVRVATGHTRDDQAETVLFRILRGSGPSGLAGILPITEEGIVRPLLFHTRQELRQFLSRRGIQWREDPSNQDPRFSRTRIRHSLLPTLERDWGPGVAERLSRLARAAEAEESYWRKLVAEGITRLAWNSDYGVIVDLERVSRLPDALIARLLRAITRSVSDSGLSAEHTSAVLALASGDSDAATVDLPALVAERSSGYLRIVASQEKKTRNFEVELAAPPSSAKLHASEIRLFKTSLQEVEIVCCSGLNKSCVYMLGGGALRFPLTLRSWQPGDRMLRSGAKHEILLAELFERARIPSWERLAWPILVQEGRIVWTRLFGSASGHEASGDPDQVLKLEEVYRNSGKGEIQSAPADVCRIGNT